MNYPEATAENASQHRQRVTSQMTGSLLSIHQEGDMTVDCYTCQRYDANNKCEEVPCLNLIVFENHVGKLPADHLT